MFTQSRIKGVATIIVSVYFFLFSTEGIVYAQSSAEKEREAQQNIYFSKIQRKEANINRKRGSRNTLMTVAVTTGLVGAGVALGTSAIYDDVENISSEPDDQDEIDAALDALDVAQSVGWGIVGLGAVSLLGYTLYSASISSEQHEIDKLYEQMNAQFGTERSASADYLPPHLQENEAAQQIWSDISEAKKSAGSSRSFASALSRLGIGCILSGGFLFGLSSLTNEVVDQIKIDELDDNGNPTNEAQARDDALDSTDSLETVGLVLLGTGVVSETTAYFLGRRAKNKEKQIDTLEEQLMQVVERLDIQPMRNGVMLSYSFQF